MNCVEDLGQVLSGREVIIAANRGPVSLVETPDGSLEYHRIGGGLVTALMGLAHHIEATWIASPSNSVDRQWGSGKISLNESTNGKVTQQIKVQFIPVDEEAYAAYYNTIANPLLWFLQHNIWDLSVAPIIDRNTWHAWEHGYAKVNRDFATAIVQRIRASNRPSLVMLQDYHLYLTPRFIRQQLSPRRKTTLMHFIHIPWPGPENWGVLPETMRTQILDGLLAVDLLGFQTREDGLNFIRCCESFLPKARVNFKRGRVWYRSRVTHVRDFPISIDVPELRRFAETSEVSQYHRQLENRYRGSQLIVRVDRTEPSKNIVRGFQAFAELLELYPDHRGKIQFLAVLVPSRLEVVEYQAYLDGLMAAAGRVNAQYGDSEWEPVRILVGENYARAIAALQLYDVLLVNSIADGMNLVAKEGPTVNLKDGVVILSERTGARQQLEPGALVISPCDVYATAKAMHQALTMPLAERAARAEKLRQIVEREDIQAWLCAQLQALIDYGL